MLTPGSKYLVQSIGSRQTPIMTRGRFLGYTSVGSDEAICIELGAEHKDLKGKVRIIPVHMVAVIDVLVEAKPKGKAGQKKRDEGPGETPIPYFG